jgi:Mn2+/Fe2+ NRAMP family transporter
MLQIESKEILGWCFTIASLVFGVFGFLYSTYAGAMSQDAAAPPISRYLRQFCWVLAFILTVLTALAVFTSYNAAVDASTWVIVACFVVLTIFSLRLAFKME